MALQPQNSKIKQIRQLSAHDPTDFKRYENSHNSSDKPVMRHSAYTIPAK